MSETKPEMRPLDEDEQSMINNRLTELGKELDEMMFVKHQAELMLDEGINVDVEVQRREYKKRLNAAENKIKEINFTLNVCEKQLNEGVIVRPENPLPKTVIVTIPDDKNYYEAVDAIQDLGLIINKPERMNDED